MLRLYSWFILYRIWKKRKYFENFWELLHELKIIISKHILPVSGSTTAPPFTVSFAFFDAPSWENWIYILIFCNSKHCDRYHLDLACKRNKRKDIILETFIVIINPSIYKKIFLMQHKIFIQATHFIKVIKKEQ